MNRNMNISTTPIATCTQPTPHIHSIEELQQLRTALRRDGLRGPQELTCPMIRAWRRQFHDTYEVDATFIPTDGWKSSETNVHGSRAWEADIQVRNILLRWHCDGWPVATPRTEGETNLNDSALQPAPTPAPNDPTCYGYAHRIRTASLTPIRKNNHAEGNPQRSSESLADQQNVDQHPVDQRGTEACTPSPRQYRRGVGKRVAFDATLLHAANSSAQSRKSNYEPGWYDNRSASAFRYAPWEIALTTMNRDASEPQPNLLDPDLLD